MPIPWYVLLAPLLCTYRQGFIGLYFSRFLPNIVTHGITPYRSFEDCRSPVFSGGDWPFIYRSVRRVVPNRFLIFFETAHLCSDVCFLI